MMIEHGIVIAGEVLAGTDWCRRDPKAWWAPGEWGTRKRAERIDLLVGHWTAGEASAQRTDDDGPVVCRVMKSRMSRRRPGRRLQVSITFVIGACAEDDDYAPVWQCLDPGLTAATHVGRGEVNERSIGVEVVSAGLPGRANVRHRPEVKVRYLGAKRRVLAFYPGQLRSWVRLAEALTGKCLPTGIEIPRRVPIGVNGGPLDRRFTRAEQRSWAGAYEHYLMDNTTKLDAGRLLLGELLAHGWDGFLVG